MKISYDADVDAMYIKLLDGEFECRNVMLTEGISLDFGPSEQLVGIEILDACASSVKVSCRRLLSITCRSLPPDVPAPASRFPANRD